MATCGIKGIVGTLWNLAITPQPLWPDCLFLKQLSGASHTIRESPTANQLRDLKSLLCCSASILSVYRLIREHTFESFLCWVSFHLTALPACSNHNLLIPNIHMKTCRNTHYSSCQTEYPAQLR